MSTLVLEQDPAILGVDIDDRFLTVDLVDGRSLRVPLSWYPRLDVATAMERRNWRILGNGYAIEWPDLDEHIGIEGLIAGRRSGESELSFGDWLAARPPTA
jgi:hypothetical protein